MSKTMTAICRNKFHVLNTKINIKSNNQLLRNYWFSNCNCSILKGRTWRNEQVQDDT